MFNEEQEKYFEYQKVPRRIQIACEYAERDKKHAEYLLTKTGRWLFEQRGLNHFKLFNVKRDLIVSYGGTFGDPNKLYKQEITNVRKVIWEALEVENKYLRIKELQELFLSILNVGVRNITNKEDLKKKKSNLLKIEDANKYLAIPYLHTIAEEFKSAVRSRRDYIEKYPDIRLCYFENNDFKNPSALRVLDQKNDNAIIEAYLDHEVYEIQDQNGNFSQIMAKPLKTIQKLQARSTLDKDKSLEE